MAAAKASLRKILQACRGGLSEAYIFASSLQVQSRLIGSPEYRDAGVVVLYAAKDGELKTDLIFSQALATNRVVLFPRVHGATVSLVRVSSPVELKPGAFNVPEPTGSEIVPVADLRQALICVPGVAFSARGQRLGRGGGFYDRLLAQASAQTTSAGLAHSFQMLDQVPESPHDRRLDLIVTASAIYRPAAIGLCEAARTVHGGVHSCL